MQNTKLLEKKEVANGTMKFTFAKPEGYEYKAGQHCTLKLINPQTTDSEGDDRTFSFVSAPYEENLMFTTRMRNTAFKNNLKSYPEGTEI